MMRGALVAAALAASAGRRFRRETENETVKPYSACATPPLRKTQ